MGEGTGVAAGQAVMSVRVASSISSSAMTSEMARRPPGLRTRAALAQGAWLVAGGVDHAVGDHHVDALVGQRQLLEVPLAKLDVLHAGSTALRRASSSISSVMSIPIARPDGPTRRAEIRTSAPAPEPRSRTTSPSHRAATAVGTPQLSEALTATFGGVALPASRIERVAEHPALVAGVAAVRAHALVVACPAAARLLLRLTAALLHGRSATGARQLSHADSSLRASGITK